MDKSIPRWVVEDYPDAVKDYSEWLFNIIYSLKDIDDSDPEVKARYTAMVRARVMERTKELSSLNERAEIYQIWKADQEGWFRHLPGEYGDLEEYLASIDDPDAKPTSLITDTKWLVHDFFPALEQHGISPNTIIGAPASWSKMRAAVPYLRSAIRDQTGEELETTLKDIISDVLDTKMSWRAFRDKLPLYKAHKEAPSVWGDVFIMPAYTMIVIRDETGGGMLRYLESRTRGVIEFRSPKPSSDLLKELSKELLGEVKIDREEIDNDQANNNNEGD